MAVAKNILTGLAGGATSFYYNGWNAGGWMSMTATVLTTPRVRKAFYQIFDGRDETQTKMNKAMFLGVGATQAISLGTALLHAVATPASLTKAFLLMGAGMTLGTKGKEYASSPTVKKIVAIAASVLLVQGVVLTGLAVTSMASGSTGLVYTGTLMGNVVSGMIDLATYRHEHVLPR